MKKAISRNQLSHSLSVKSRVINFPESFESTCTTESTKSEEALEKRLRELTALVADLTDSGYGFLLAEEAATQEAFEELRVKEAALRWIVRVAKHSSGAVREKLWSDAEEAVSSLEKTADLLLGSELILPHAFAANHRGRVAGRGRF
ncbi:MAG: hypothetical protein WB780_15795 [Candidatus Acidiferrales bacterium]